ncbi:penicillin-binding protein [Pseudalkalibacillus hwajinpoensis]|uniref:PASTA domain-containing protein n=1 Tax=Guptibacillus hwajinpoensis TaxID=208199 RepID=A0A4U1MMF1_9BACL|nr:penicillin-binding protein [Pseudalkalibacillus hwajinpoensis]TKD71752.1 PASTA domain-containing protein [Pseudalkalibacillus hwajinpoensis]
MRETNKNPHINVGAAILMSLFVLLFFAFIGRFFYIEWTHAVSGVDGEKVDLMELGQEKWTRSKILEADRGTIYDRTGENELATDIPSFTLRAILDQNYDEYVKDIDETASKLAPIIEMKESDIKEILSREEVFQVEFGSAGKNLSLTKKEKIEELDLPGVGFIPTKTRLYPNEEFASHLLGFTNENEKGVQEGLLGLEKQLNKYLVPQPGKETYQSDRQGFRLPYGNENITPSKSGNDVYLTIDEKIQLFMERAMNEAQEKYNPERMTAIVADPDTGKILAMGNRPTFDPNLRDISNYTNMAISSFEPGSTMKIFTLAAAIEEGVYSGDELYQSGRYKVPGGSVPDHNNGEGWGVISFDEGIRNSSNVAASILVKEKLGFDRYKDYLSKFGFEKKTGIDLPGEGTSQITYSGELERISTGFGQGSTITPIQQVQAATSIANGGKMMKPYVIEKIVDPDSNKVKLNHEPKVVGEPISKETAAHTREILRSVVTDGTGTPYNIEGYTIAGKTGTAQISQGAKGYMSGYGNNVFSFIGMAPAEDPELIVYVAVDRPQLEYPELGSDPVSLIFNTIMKNSLQYLNIDPIEKKETNSKKQVDENGSVLKDVTGMDVKQAKKELGGDLEVLALGKGEVVSQSPHAGSKILDGERIILQTKDKVTMPNITGWSLADVMKLVELMDLKPNMMGSGYVTKQGIKPGSVVKKGDYLVAELKTPSAEEKPAEKSDEATEAITD